MIGAKRNFDRLFCSPCLPLKEFELFSLSIKAQCWRKLIPSEDVQEPSFFLYASVQCVLAFLKAVRNGGHIILGES